MCTAPSSRLQLVFSLRHNKRSLHITKLIVRCRSPWLRKSSMDVDLIRIRRGGLKRSDQIISGRTAGAGQPPVCQYSEVDFGFFATPGRQVAPMKVKFGELWRYESIVRTYDSRAKFNLHQYQGIWVRRFMKTVNFDTFGNIIAPCWHISCAILTNFLANVNSRSLSLCAVSRLSVLCNVRAPYSAGWNFRQYF